ncbi:type 1 glutamine amidotransferase domain-containing protein [Lentilactobacillus farraginis]|uniref:ThiJ/PfpI family protein n=2 Tax=Lentilactobacillus farraginis DSM 18382 = JCM 14108 TaxID=1423743 RepID=X0PJ45_9LACO|nr:type 1 glutamine amidotransferase domain-containing protein [Lentilactobacillus farraginis]GAF37222.1 ThiJ/PfpI family protein [Lentilactobacillus farraginis DSM 18382 = JCM 14108]
MKKALVVLTNTPAYGATNHPTGLWLGEATEFVSEMAKANIPVDYVSPKGGFVPLDPRSMKYVTAPIMSVYKQPDFIKRALTSTLQPSQVDPNDYQAIYYAGGHGVMWDFPNNVELQAIAAKIYQAGGYITAVCHGVAGLLNIRDTQGNYLIAGKKITGFTTAEEILAGKKSSVPFLNKTEVEKRGGNFVKKRAYKEFVVQDGQFITGQNPFSAQAVAKKLIQAIGS